MHAGSCSWWWEPTAQNEADTRLPLILRIQTRTDFAMPPIPIMWLIQAECKCTRVIPIYEPVARVQHYHAGCPDYLLSSVAGCSFDFLHGPRRQGCEAGNSCTPTSFSSIGLSKTSILWSMKAFFASPHPWSYSWLETFWQTIAGLQVFQPVSYCITRSCLHLIKMASLRTSYYSVSNQSSYHVSTTYLPTSKTTVTEHPRPDCTKHK